MQVGRNTALGDAMVRKTVIVLLVDLAVWRFPKGSGVSLHLF